MSDKYYWLYPEKKKNVAKAANDFLQSANLQEKKDKHVINSYESIPDYDILERTFDKTKKAQYEKKQSLANDYSQAKTRQTEKFIADNGITYNLLETAFGGPVEGLPGSPKAESKAYLEALANVDMSALEKYYTDQLNAKAIKNVEKATEDAPVVMNALSAVGSPLSNMGYSAISGLDYLTGKDYSRNLEFSMDMNNAIRSTTKDMIDANTTGMGNKVANVGYDVGMGVADNLATLALAGGNPAVMRGMMTASAAGGGMYDAEQRGLTQNQAMAEGLASASAEWLLGKLPIDTMFGANGKNVVGNIMKQAGAEAVEEGGTSLLNEIVDIAIAGDKSNFNLLQQAYMDSGMSQEAAYKQAWLDTAKNIGYEGLVGGLSGGVIGAGNTAVQRMRGNMPLEPLAEMQMEGTAKAAPEIEPLNALQAFSEQVGQKKTQGKKITDVVEKELLNADYVKTHTSDELTTMTEYLSSANQDIVDYINDVRKNDYSATGEVFELDTVDNVVAQKMQEITGIDTTGYKLLLTPQAIRHIDIDHGVNGKADHTMADDETIARFEYVLGNYDLVYAGKGSGMFKMRGGKKSPTVVFEKKVDGKYYVVEALPDTDAKANYIVSMYTKKEGKSLPNVQAPGVTSMTETTLPSNDSIPNSTENVNADAENQRIRSYNNTLIERTDAPAELKNEFINNPDMYTQLSNAETLNSALEILENNSVDGAIATFHRLLDGKNPVAVPLGYNISKQLASEGRLDESVQIVRDMSKALTESGQFSQAAAITMMNNDPEASKRYLIREIDTLNQKGAEKYGKKWKNFELTENELKRFNDIQPGDTEAIQQLYQDVYNRLSKAYPSTMTEKLLEYRRIAMLLNLRTNVRNVVSNALLFPVRWTADRVAALGEGAYSLINPKYSRTQSLNPIRSKQSKKLAAEAFNTVKEELLGTNKYEDSKGAIRDRQVFKGTVLSRAMDSVLNGAITKANQAMGKDINPSLMETARNFTYYLLQEGDNWFVKKNFESRMASYLDAQGITDLESIPADAYMLATQEAMKATFKDDSSFANTLSQFRQLLNKIPGGFVGEAIMPFTKTPANLAMRGIDYSPIGIRNGVKTLANAKSQADVANGITQLGQAVTGTAAIALGYVLAELGLVTGALSEDKDEAQFQKQQGMLPYAFNINGNYFSYDWAQPASIPLILGVTIYDSWNNEKDFLSGLMSGSLAAVDSWLELSPLQNLSDIFGGYGTPAESVWAVLATDLPLSFIPSQMNAITKTIDTTQRTAYSPDYWDNLSNQAQVKVPSMSENLPVSYDTWGNPIERQDNIGEAFFANFINPGQFGNDNVTAIDDEISELYEDTKDAAVFPKKASWTVNGVKLDNEQYSEYQQIMGSKSYDMAEALIESNYYRKLDDEQRVSAISNMYNFADALAKHEVIGYDVEGSNTYKKTYSVYEEKGAKGVAEYLAIKEIAEGSKNYQIVEAVDSFNMSDNDKGYYISVLVNSMSKAANEAYESGGYAAVYKHYMEATEEDREAESKSYLDPFFFY